MLCVTSQFIFSLYLFGSYISQYQAFTYTTLVIAVSFALSTLAFLPVMIHVLRMGTISLLNRSYLHRELKRSIDVDIVTLIEEWKDYKMKAGDDALPLDTWLKERKSKDDMRCSKCGGQGVIKVNGIVYCHLNGNIPSCSKEHEIEGERIDPLGETKSLIDPDVSALVEEYDDYAALAGEDALPLREWFKEKKRGMIGG